MQYKTKGIILKRSNLGEADRILTIFTEKHGKIKAIAKGIRKTLSKLAGHLEPFCLVDLIIAEGRNLDIITDVQTIKCFFKLRSNLKSTNTAYYLAEIIDKMTAENEAHPPIFNLLEEVLENINGGLGDLSLAYYEINFLTETGYKPELYYCLSCRSKISTGDNHFNFESGGIICKQCNSKAGGRKISDTAIKILRLFLQHKIPQIQKIKAHKDLIQEVSNVARDYLKYIHQKEFNSERFLQK